MDASKAIFDVLLMLGTAGKEKIKKSLHVVLCYS